jgi:hypothetical protein
MQATRNARIGIVLSIIVLALTRQWVSPVNSASVIAVIPVPSNPVSTAVNADTNRIYVGHNSGGRVSVIDGSTNCRIADILGLDCFLLGITSNPVTTRVYAVTASSLVYYQRRQLRRLLTQIPDGPTGTTLLNVAVNSEILEYT